MVILDYPSPALRLEMEHFGVFGVIFNLIIGTWVVIYTFQVSKLHNYPVLGPLVFHTVLYNLAMLCFLFFIYFTFNFPENYLSQNLPALAKTGEVAVLLIQIGMVYALLRISLGFFGRDFSRRIKTWIGVGAGAVILSYGVMLLLPSNSAVSRALRTVLSALSDNFIVLEVPVLIALLIIRGEKLDKHYSRIRRIFAGLYLFRHILLLGVILVIVLFPQLVNQDTGNLSIPRWIRHSLLTLLLIAFNLFPFFWLRMFFLKYAESKLQVVEDIDRLAHFYQTHRLSRREQEILELLLAGKDNKEIGKILFISYHTVKNHVYNIYQKLGVRNRYQAVSFITRSISQQKK